MGEGRADGGGIGVFFSFLLRLAVSLSWTSLSFCPFLCLSPVSARAESDDSRSLLRPLRERRERADKRGRDGKRRELTNARYETRKKKTKNELRPFLALFSRPCPFLSTFLSLSPPPPSPPPPPAATSVSHRNPPLRCFLHVPRNKMNKKQSPHTSPLTSQRCRTLLLLLLLLQPPPAAAAARAPPGPSRPTRPSRGRGHDGTRP